MVGRDMAGCLPLLMMMPIIPIMAAVIFPSLQGRGLWAWYGLSLLLAAIGIGFLAYARLPLYRQKKFLSIGSRELPKDRLPAYKWSWLFLGISICIQLLLLLLTK